MASVDPRAAASAPIPILLLIDCEPDPREVPLADPPQWTGFERMFDFMSAQRARLADATGHPAGLNWFWRMDPQIETAYGRIDWGVATYAAQLREMQQRGDGIGLHAHAWRWDEAGGFWIVDHGNMPWVESCVRRSFAAYRAAFGRDCELFRFGDGWFDAALIPLLEELGARIDLTVEPGLAAKPGEMPHERATGAIPDRRGAPQSPYRPARRDFRRPDDRGETALWLLPQSAAVRTKRPRLTRPLKLWRWWRSGRLPLPMMLDTYPPHFRRALRRALRAARPAYVAIAARSDIAVDDTRAAFAAQNLETILRHPDAARFRFVTAGEALAMLTADAR